MYLVITICIHFYFLKMPMYSLKWKFQELKRLALGFDYQGLFYSTYLYFQVVLVTGASSGLGEALAHALYRRGARLILASRNTEKLQDIKETLLKTYKVGVVFCVMYLFFLLELRYTAFFPFYGKLMLQETILW